MCVCAGLSLWISSGPAAELPPSDGGGQREAEKTDGGGSCWTLWHRECGRGREGHRDGEYRPAAEPAALPPSGDVLNCDMEHKGLCSREVLEVRAAGLWVNLAAALFQRGLLCVTARTAAMHRVTQITRLHACIFFSYLCLNWNSVELSRHHVNTIRHAACGGSVTVLSLVFPTAAHD